MFCIVEIGLTILGIVILATGRVKWLGGKEVYKGVAYLIGAILTATFPLALGLGVVIGISLAQEGRNVDQIEKMAAEFWYVDIVLVGVIVVIAGILTAVSAKTPQRPQYGQPYAGPNQFGPQQFPPADPNNPYQSPYSGPGTHNPGAPQQYPPPGQQYPPQQFPPPDQQGQWPPPSGK